MARDAGAITIDNSGEDVYERLLDLTGGIGPDVCIDAVGMEAHGTNLVEHVYDKVKTNLMLESERPAVVRQAIECCRKGGHRLHPRRLRRRCPTRSRWAR